MRKLLDTLKAELKDYEDKYNNIDNLGKDPATCAIMRLKILRKIYSKKEVIQKRIIQDQETAAKKNEIWKKFNKNYCLYLDSDNL